MFRSHSALLLSVLAVAGCGGKQNSSAAGIPGGDGNTSGSVAATLTIGSDLTIAKGRTHQFQAQLAHDGTLDDCTASAGWTSSDPAVASISGGAATALGLGQTTITASCSGSTGSATLVVTDAEVVTIAVTPATGELAVGLSEQLTAIATLTDGTTADVTGDAHWDSSNKSAFSVDAVNPGVIKAMAGAVGQSSTISASLASGPLATVTRKVTDATLTAIAVTASADSPIAFDPLAPSVPLGVDVQFHATGTFSDGASNDVTPSVTWASDNAGVASIATPGGLATTLATGSAKISAKCGAVAAPLTSLDVTAAVVASVAIDQDGATFTVGETPELTGTATLTDDTPQAVTLTGWTSSVPGVATVSPTGLLTAVAEGFTTIGASYTTADGRTLTDTTQMNVVPPTSAPVLSYLSLKPGSVKGGKQKLTGTVVLTAPATPYAVFVTLTSSAPTLVTPPATAMIPMGKASAQFSISTSAPTRKQKVTITATLGAQSKVATLNLR